jgi:dihydroorotate dehydrogenase electron transfer subunit
MEVNYTSFVLFMELWYDPDMKLWQGIVREIRLGSSGRSAWIECPAQAQPAPGQYLLGWAVDDAAASLAVTLFPAAFVHGRFLAAAPVPLTWEPGAILSLQGPLGRGFDLPVSISRLVMAAFGDTLDRLAVLLPQVLRRNCSVAICAGCELPSLPPEVEIYPLDNLGELIPWADYMVLDTPRSAVDRLKELMDLTFPPGQALIVTAMPCGGLGQCGACAVQGQRGLKLVCQDGPVFSLDELALSAG